MTNFFLAWYLDEVMPSYICDAEGLHSDRRRFDVVIKTESDHPCCNIWIKRLFSSSSIGEYLNKFKRKIKEVERAEGNLALLLFPLYEVKHPKRIDNLVKGYGYLSEHIGSFFREDDIFVRSLPVPLKVKKPFWPLQTIKGHIREEFDLF